MKPLFGSEGNPYLLVTAETTLDAIVTEKVQSMTDTFRALTTAGAVVPEDIPWTPCIRKIGTALNTPSGDIEARMVNGVVSLRGYAKHNITATGSYTSVWTLPPLFPRPKYEFHVAVWAIATQTAYRIGLARVNIDGDIALSAPTGAFDTASLDNISYRVF